MVEVLVNLWDRPKSGRPTEAVGDWHVSHQCLFEHDHAPTAAKYLIEKMTVQLLRREPLDITRLALRYSGTSGAGGHPSTVRLELRAVHGSRFLYALTHERTAPKRWENEQRLAAECERTFAHWRAQLHVVAADASWPAAPRERLERVMLETAAAEDAAARIVEDPVPIAAVQRQVLDALRAGMGFFTAHKEGGSHLFFDGRVFRRNDYGEEPNLTETYADDAAMLAALRRFYDWDARSDTYPHPKPELDVWRFIHAQLKRR